VTSHVRALGLGVAVMLTAGCPKSGRVSGPVPDTLTPFAAPPTSVEYARYTVAGPFDLPVLTHREEWAGPTPIGDDLTWDVATWDTTGGARDLLETVRVYLGPGGYGFVGTVEDGTLIPWDPPQQLLPADPHVGDTWQQTHTKAGRSSERSCEIQAEAACDGGLVVVCESQKPSGVVVLRDHFCPDEGWVGFEALQRVDDQPPVRMWSEQVVRDGQPSTALARPDDDDE